jgi:hypothetical protein
LARQHVSRVDDVDDQVGPKDSFDDGAYERRQVLILGIRRGLGFLLEAAGHTGRVDLSEYHFIWVREDVHRCAISFWSAHPQQLLRYEQAQVQRIGDGWIGRVCTGQESRRKGLV